MYQITCDDEVLYDLRTDNRLVINPALDLELNTSGTLSFYIPVTNPCSIRKLNGIFRLFKDNKKIFEGRCLNDNKDFYNTKKISVLGVLDYFNDSIVRPFEMHNISTSDFLKYLIDNHNKQVDEFKKFKLGKVDVVDFDGEETLYRKSEEYKSSWEIIKDRLIDRLGGYIIVRYEDDGNYIDYLQKSGKESAQCIMFGSNLLDLTEYVKGENIKTCIIPLGKDNLNISSVNNNKDYIYDEAAVKLYGWIWDTVKFDDITVANNLLNKGKKYLQECINLTSTIELSAVDLSLINKNVDSFKLGEYPLVVSKLHGLSKYMQISKMSIELDNTTGGKITLGNTMQGLTDKNIEAVKKINKIDNINADISGLSIEVNNNTVNINSLNTSVDSVNTDLTDVNKQLNKQKKYIILGV